MAIIKFDTNIDYWDDNRVLESIGKLKIKRSSLPFKILASFYSDQPNSIPKESLDEFRIFDAVRLRSPACLDASYKVKSENPVIRRIDDVIL